MLQQPRGRYPCGPIAVGGCHRAGLRTLFACLDQEVAIFGRSERVLASSSLRVGLINTMVFTHIPSSVCLVLAAVTPSVEIALALLLIRSALSQMDVPTRSSYVMAVVTPPERPAAASVTSVPRSVAAAASPTLAGALFAAGFEAWPLVICGALKIA